MECTITISDKGVTLNCNRNIRKYPGPIVSVMLNKVLNSMKKLLQLFPQREFLFLQVGEKSITVR